MRWSEIVESQEVLEAASNLPHKYVVDDTTDLALNPPNQWSQSPYLGAVKDPKGPGYMAQIHVPQDVWTAMVDQNPGKWSQAPQSFFHPTGNQRPSMIVRFKDPRRAAWFAQEVLYGGDVTPREVIEDYFDQRYNGGDGELWKSIARQAPQYEGEALTQADEKEFFANQGEHQKKVVQQKNANNYEATMLPKIKRALVDFYARNRALAKKRLGNVASLAQIEQRINDVVAHLGVQYFVTAPGSVKLKDVASLALA